MITRSGCAFQWNMVTTGLVAKCMTQNKQNLMYAADTSGQHSNQISDSRQTLLFHRQLTAIMAFWNQQP